jgi:hypothetical protein
MARAIRWVGAAAIVHLGAIALVLVVGARERAREGPRAQAEVGAIEVSVEEVVEERAEAKSEEGVAGVSARATARGGRGTGTGTGRQKEERGTGAGAPESGGVEEWRAGGDGSGVVAVPLTAEQLGIGGRNFFLPRAAEKEPAGPRIMRGTGLERDRDIGLGPEGPAITALSDATTTSIAPLKGRALFVVRAGGDGLVWAVELLDSEGGSGWRDAGRIALEKLRGKKMRMPVGASALNMRIEVRSEMKLPNGESAPIGGRLGENSMPELTIPDVSNLGAKPRRVVHARGVGTEIL